MLKNAFKNGRKEGERSPPKNKWARIRAGEGLLFLECICIDEAGKLRSRFHKWRYCARGGRAKRWCRPPLCP